MYTLNIYTKISNASSELIRSFIMTSVKCLIARWKIVKSKQRRDLNQRLPGKNDYILYQ